MEIITKKIKDIKPYENNPRKNDDAVDLVANSIREFGFKVPIVIDKDNVIVTGHTRYKASKKLGLTEVPCIIADDLTKEQIQAFRLADNKVAERADWDFELLDIELGDISLDMEQFGFEFLTDIEHEKYKEETDLRAIDLFNTDIANYGDEDTPFDIPALKPTTKIPNVKEWIGFNYVLSEKDPAGKGVHFFLHDYQFERVWNDPQKYLEKLKQYECVLSPDFSPFGDIPLALQIYNIYRKNWCARYWQDNGITVIPTVTASADDRLNDIWLAGIPKGNIVCTSTMWWDENVELNEQRIDQLKNKIEPSKIIVYGKQVDCIQTDCYIETFSKKRFGI